MHGDVIIIRLIFTAILVVAGYILHPFFTSNPDSVGFSCDGLLVAACIMACELRIRRATPRETDRRGCRLILGIVEHSLPVYDHASESQSHSAKLLHPALVFFMAWGDVGGAGDHIEPALGDFLISEI
jgi:hypothetical protein